MKARLEAIIALTLLLVGSILRILFAPYSTGSDIAQFYGFARSFSADPLCIYMHETSTSREWPYSWLYPYGPFFAFLLSIVYELVGDHGDMVEWWWEGDRYVVVVDRVWILSLKAVFIAGDIIAAYLLYRIAKPRGMDRGLLLAALYYFSPIVVYTSSIYGMFDSIALAFMLASLAITHRPLVSGIMAGTAVMVKQTMILPVLLTGLVLVMGATKRLFWYIIGVVLAVSLPLSLILLSCPESSFGLVLALQYQSQVYYPKPLVYSMNGFSSIATYINDVYGYDTLTILRLWPLTLGLISVAVIMRALDAKVLRDPILTASLGYIAFIISYWRINPQYLAPLAAFTLLLLFKCGNTSSRLRAAIISSFIIVNMWPMIYPVDFWFHVHIEEPNEEVRSIVRLLSLNIYDNIVYVAYSLVLSITLLIVLFYILYKCKIMGVQHVRRGVT